MADELSWSREMFGQCDLGDQRRTRRLVDVAARLARHAGGSLAQSCQSEQAAALGGYRLISNDQVEAQAIAESGFEAVARACAQQAGDLLALEDTTSLKYTHAVAAHLGRVGSLPQSKQRGYLVHSVLLVGAQSERTLGLLEQRRWCRDDASYGKKHTRRHRAYPDKESFKWQQASERVAQRLDEQSLARTISVCDRESDIYEYLRYKLEQGQRFVVRARCDRMLSDQTQSLFAAVQEQGKVSYDSTVEIAQRGGRAARKASVKVYAHSVSLSAPAQLGKNNPTLQLNVVRVSEACADKQALNWVLLSSEALETVEQVKKIVRYYELRWRIEEYHKAWKSGTGAERLRQQSPGNLERMLTITAFVAVRLLQLREHLSQDKPSEAATNCEEILQRDEWQVLWLTQYKTALPASPPSIAWACLAVARLGGFLDTKHTGRPGWNTLWEGWQRLQERVQGLRLARELEGKM